MRRRMPRLILLLGVLLLVVGGLLAWRSLHPPLSDEQQIVANLEGIRGAIESRQARAVTNYLAPDFRYDGMTRSELNNNLAGAFFQWHDVHLEISSVQVKVQGDRAVSTGHYTASVAAGQGSAPEQHAGNCTLNWERRKGRWVVTNGGTDEKLAE